MGGERGRYSYILTSAFGTTVAMWAVGYVGRLPGIMAPSWLLLVALLVCVLGGGWLAGRLAGAGWRGGAAVGLVVAALNMLILGSLLSGGPESVVPSALIWVPGAFVACALLAAVGAAAGEGVGGGDVGDVDWTGGLAAVAAAATFLQLVSGGLVTSNEAGLAVADWPRSFGYNMFLYPLARMTGGIYFEHAHRLFGSLVGLTTVVLALHLARVDSRRWVRRLALLAVILVVTQGILGGLRVTGHLTLATDRTAMAPSLTLAVVHGVLGQVFLGVMVALAVVATRRFRAAGAPERRASVNTDRTLQTALIALLVGQIVLGAIQRHLAQGILIHVTMAVFVAVVGAAAGARAWALYPNAPVVHRLGRWLVVALGIQLVLGVAALGVTGGEAVRGNPSAAEVLITTAHQATGAALLALAIALAIWTRRRLSPDG